MDDTNVLALANPSHNFASAPSLAPKLRGTSDRGSDGSACPGCRQLSTLSPNSGLNLRLAEVLFKFCGRASRWFWRPLAPLDLFRWFTGSFSMALGLGEESILYG